MVPSDWMAWSTRVFVAAANHCIVEARSCFEYERAVMADGDLRAK